MKLRKNIVDRVLRGGAYFNVVRDLRVILRDWDLPGSRDGLDGFRFVIRGKK